jgi:hypothetical protein
MTLRRAPPLPPAFRVCRLPRRCRTETSRAIHRRHAFLRRRAHRTVPWHAANAQRVRSPKALACADHGLSSRHVSFLANASSRPHGGPRGSRIYASVGLSTAAHPRDASRSAIRSARSVGSVAPSSVRSAHQGSRGTRERSVARSVRPSWRPSGRGFLQYGNGKISNLS